MGSNLSFLGISLYWWALIIGTVASIVMNIVRRKLFDYSVTKAIVLGILLTLYGCIGTKVLYILEHVGEPITLGGMSLFGAIFLIPVEVFLTALIMNEPYGKVMDFAGLNTIFGTAFMRVGCFINGCCGPRDIVINGVVHHPPIQLYECVLDLIAYFFLFWQERTGRMKATGEEYPKVMILYAIIRLIMEPFRDTPKNIAGLSEGQWLAIASFVIGFIALYFVRKHAAELAKQKKKHKKA